MLLYNIILANVPEAGSCGNYWVYIGLRGAAKVELPAFGKVLRIILCLHILQACITNISINIFKIAVSMKTLWDFDVFFSSKYKIMQEIF